MICCYLSSDITTRLFLRLTHYQDLIAPAYSGVRLFLHVAEETRQSPGICLVVEEQVTSTMYDLASSTEPVSDMRQNASFRSCGRRDWRQKG